MKKLVSLLSILLVGTMLTAGCAGSGATEPAEAPETPDPPVAEEQPADPIRIGLLLPGQVSDMGWNATAYNALLAVEEEYGAEIAYTESIPASDYEDMFRRYADDGFDMIFGHGFEFGDAALKAAEDYPDTLFFVTSSDITNGKNVGSGRILVEQNGFLAGALAALMSENQIVAGIGGTDIPPIRASVQGFIAGAKYVNPDITVHATMTGSNTDVAGAKETALAMINNNNVDVIYANLNVAGMGSIEACQESGIWAVGSNQDQNPAAPETVFQSVIQDYNKLFTYVVGLVLEGTYDAKYFGIGVSEDAVRLADWHGYDERFPEVKDGIEEIIEGMKNGTISFNHEDYTF